MVGETIDPGDEICGARVVDKSTGTRCMYRLELWLRKKDDTVAKDLLGAMVQRQACAEPSMPMDMALTDTDK